VEMRQVWSEVERRASGNGRSVRAIRVAMKAMPSGVNHAARKDTHLTNEDAPVRRGINAQTPNTMPRAEDDEATRAHSPEFHDRPGSGKHTADRQRVF